MKPSKNIVKIKWLLYNNKETQDNDNALISAIWYDDMIKLGKNPQEINALNVLDLLTKGLLTNTESIRRCRQMLQKEFPELRGKKYTERHKHKESVLEDLFQTPEFLKGGTP